MCTICNKSLLAKRMEKVKKNPHRILWMYQSDNAFTLEFRIQIIIEEYSIHARYVPNFMNTNTQNETVYHHKSIEEEKYLFCMLRVKIESFYHLTICNSIHFFPLHSFLLASLIRNFGMMGRVFMQRIH